MLNTKLFSCFSSTVKILIIRLQFTDISAIYALVICNHCPLSMGKGGESLAKVRGVHFLIVTAVQVLTSKSFPQGIFYYDGQCKDHSFDL